MDINVIDIGLSAVRVLAIGLLFGAGLPALFALGMRLQSAGSGAVSDDGSHARRNPAATALAYVVYAIVIAAVIAGVLFVTRHSLSHYFDISIFGA